MKFYRILVFVVMLLILLNSAIAYDLSEYPSPFIKDGKFNGVIVVGDNAPAEDIIIISDLVLSLQYPILGSEPESVSGIDTLQEKQTKTYTIGGKDYEVTLNYINKDSAQFVVNGMTTARLSIGDGDTLVDGTRITLADIFFENKEYSTTIFFGKKKIDVTKTIVESGSAKLASEVDDLKSLNSIVIGHACDNPLILEVRRVKDDCKSGYNQGVGTIEAYEFPNGKVSIIITGYSTNDTFNAAQILRFHGYYKTSLKGNKIDVSTKNGKLVAKSYIESKKSFDGNASLKSSFDESYSKLGIFTFLLLIFILLFLIFRKKPKKSTKFK